MNLSLYRLMQKIGLPPVVWMFPNPTKIYEFNQVVSGVRLQPGETILDFGCGKGHWTAALARQVHLAVGLDTSPGQVQTAQAAVRHSALKKRLKFLCQRIEDADFTENSFDHVFSFCVLEHIENLAEVLGHMRRVLRPGGGLHVSVDSLGNLTDPALRQKHKHDHAVYQYFTPDSLTTQLQDAGFAVQTMFPIMHSSFAAQEFTRRIHESYKYGPLERYRVYQRLLREDQAAQPGGGLMLVAHAVVQK